MIYLNKNAFLHETVNVYALYLLVFSCIWCALKTESMEEDKKYSNHKFTHKPNQIETHQEQSLVCLSFARGFLSVKVLEWNCDFFSNQSIIFFVERRILVKVWKFQQFFCTFESQFVMPWFCVCYFFFFNNIKYDSSARDTLKTTRVDYTTT